MQQPCAWYLEGGELGSSSSSRVLRVGAEHWQRWPLPLQLLGALRTRASSLEGGEVVKELGEEAIDTLMQC